jgi:hypothetical protein
LAGALAIELAMIIRWCLDVSALLANDLMVANKQKGCWQARGDSGRKQPRNVDEMAGIGETGSAAIAHDRVQRPRAGVRV